MKGEKGAGAIVPQRPGRVTAENPWVEVRELTKRVDALTKELDSALARINHLERELYRVDQEKQGRDWDVEDLGDKLEQLEARVFALSQRPLDLQRRLAWEREYLCPVCDGWLKDGWCETHGHRNSYLSPQFLKEKSR